MTKRSSARQVMRFPLPVSSAATPMRAPDRFSNAANGSSGARTAKGRTDAPAITERREYFIG
jgi:hypothetical protein